MKEETTLDHILRTFIPARFPAILRFFDVKLSFRKRFGCNKEWPTESNR